MSCQPIEFSTVKGPYDLFDVSGSNDKCRAILQIHLHHIDNILPCRREIVDKFKDAVFGLIDLCSNEESCGILHLLGGTLLCNYFVISRGSVNDTSIHPRKGSSLSAGHSLTNPFDSSGTLVKMSSTSAAIFNSVENVTINGGDFTLNASPGSTSKLGAYYRLS